MLKQIFPTGRRGRIDLGRASHSTKGAFGFGLELTGKEVTAGLSDD